jgi:phosphatidate cytidylyltransferase
MSPANAIHSHIFLTYAAIVVGILFVAGAALALMKFGLRKDIHSIWLTYAGWLIMIPIIAAAIFLGRWAVIAGVTALALLGFTEFARAARLSEGRWITGAVYLSILAAGVVTVLNRFNLFLALPAFATSLIVLIPVLRNRTQGQLRSISLATFAFVYIGWMFAHLGWLANTANPYGYLIFLILATELNDVAAFTFGKLFGHYPLRSQISPRKTWGGAIGAVGVSIILPWALRFSLPGFSGRQLLLTGLLIGIGGQLGDLVLSIIKRDTGIKDMGASIPGHGGILDRIDSLIFVAPLFLYMLEFFDVLR